MNIWIIITLLVALPASGCSIKMVSYSPSILMEGTGSVTVGEFQYLPGDEGKLGANQVDTGMGLNPIESEIAIKDYVSEAVKKELKFIGYKLDARSPIVISGDIAEYSCDYVGLTTVDIRTRIEWIVSREENGKFVEVYKKMHEGIHSSSKWTTMEITLVLNEALRKNIKSFVEDAQSKHLL